MASQDGRVSWLFSAGPLTWMGFGIWVLAAWAAYVNKGRLTAVHPFAPAALFKVGLAVFIALFWADAEGSPGRYALPLTVLTWIFFTAEFHGLAIKRDEYL